LEADGGVMKIFVPANEWLLGDRIEPPSMTVIEADPAPRFSGLLDACGNKLMVIDRPEPIGFVKFRPD
jgi:hypothetical protein